MRTKNSIDLTQCSEPCYAAKTICPHNGKPGDVCGTADCPFYKPKDCIEWIRIEDKDGIHLIPPEEYYQKRERQRKLSKKPPTWKVTRKRA